MSWVNDLSRHSCYALVDEYRDAAHEVGPLTFCEDDSAFRPAIESYVEEYGR